jgi:AcrR family transcriptional regulator
MREQESPIAKRSKKWLAESLLLLLRKKTYNELTIGEIAEKAGLSRRTFYRQFPSKDAVLSAALSEVFDEYTNRLSAEKDLSMKTIARAFFDFWSDRLTLLRSLDRSGLLPFLLEAMNNTLPLIYARVNKNPNEYGDADDRRYILAFGCGGFWNMLIFWMHEGTTRRPDDLADIFERAIAAMPLKQ